MFYLCHMKQKIKDTLFRILVEANLYKFGESDTFTGNTYTYKVEKSINNWWDLELYKGEKLISRTSFDCLAKLARKVCLYEGLSY